MPGWCRRVSGLCAWAACGVRRISCPRAPSTAPPCTEHRAWRTMCAAPVPMVLSLFVWMPPSTRVANRCVTRRAAPVSIGARATRNLAPAARASEASSLHPTPAQARSATRRAWRATRRCAPRSAALRAMPTTAAGPVRRGSPETTRFTAGTRRARRVRMTALRSTAAAALLLARVALAFQAS